MSSSTISRLVTYVHNVRYVVQSGDLATPVVRACLNCVRHESSRLQRIVAMLQGRMELNRLRCRGRRDIIMRAWQSRPVLCKSRRTI